MDISSLTEVTEDPSYHLREGYFFCVRPAYDEAAQKSAAFHDVRKAALRLVRRVSFRSL